jgi:hypothetical protein
VELFVGEKYSDKFLLEIDFHVILEMFSCCGNMELFVGEKCSETFRLEIDFHVILETFYVPHICDMGQTALLPLRRKVC